MALAKKTRKTNFSLKKNNSLKQFYVDVTSSKKLCFHGSIGEGGVVCPKNPRTTILSKYVLPNFQYLYYGNFMQKIRKI